MPKPRSSGSTMIDGLAVGPAPGLHVQALRLDQVLPILLDHGTTSLSPATRNKARRSKRNEARRCWRTRGLLADTIGAPGAPGARRGAACAGGSRCAGSASRRGSSVIVKPTACSARSADSRPEPGPRTWTSSDFMPCSAAFLPACSPAIWAANGVLLREPLKPCEPAARPGDRVALRVGDGDHGVVERGVHVRHARGDVLALAPLQALRGFGSSHYFFVAFFLPAIARAGPLRVRALVWVRWPRTGRPLR